jgi:hypothetical protein
MLRARLDGGQGGRRRWALALAPLLVPRRALGAPRTALAAAAAAVVAAVALWAHGSAGGARAGPARGEASFPPQEEATMDVSGWRAGAAALALAAAVEAGSPFEGTFAFRMERPGWTPREVTGTLRMEKGAEGWTGALTLLDLSNWSDVPLEDLRVDRKGFTAIAAHPIWRLKIEGARSKGGLEGSVQWGANRFAFEGRATKQVRFEKGVAEAGFLRRGDADRLGIGGPSAAPPGPWCSCP